MEDVYLQEEAIMAYGVPRQNRIRRDFFYLVDREFVEATRFTKEHVEYMTHRLEPHLSRVENQRGCPMTPLNQVCFHL